MSGRQLLRLGRTYRHVRLTAAAAQQLHMGQANVPQSTPGINTKLLNVDTSERILLYIFLKYRYPTQYIKHQFIIIILTNYNLKHSRDSNNQFRTVLLIRDPVPF
jgi:hypothetical protein